ncbi:MAG TPA: ATP-binding protein [Aggregatilinea sp.]|uniref:ATP-binding protein n=1 Tax=Aggregatilinea sp. TaxID=2806333 RepID=UPI002CAFE882|nr:ATP-binding protein [Aggregatilinea sp.]HML24497.1 ATP-binding protein [Aggregatilinea sp.]
MHTSTATLFSIGATVTLAIIGMALVLLVVWQDPYRRSNQYFGLASLTMAVYGIFASLWRVIQQFDLEPRPIFYVLATLYIVAVVLLCKFTLAFAEVSTRIRRADILVSVPLMAGSIALIWTDQAYKDFIPADSGSYRYSFTPFGYVMTGMGIAYLLACIFILRRQHTLKSREMMLAMTLMLVGVTGLSVIPILRRYPFNSLAIAISMVSLGRQVIKYQVFQPLEDLNAELALKNAEIIEASRAKSQFLANMSHELRTPLNSIIGYTDLVLNRTYGDVTETQVDRLEKVRRNGRLLLELINDVLDLSRIEAGRLELSFSRVDTTTLLDGVVQQFAGRALEKGLTLIRAYGDLPVLWADEGRTNQILTNLLSNAVRYTEKGCVIVRGHYDASLNHVIISITDTGIGIPIDQQTLIFNAFMETDGRLTRAQDGTGLGLAITQQLVKLHHGDLWFESVEGSGSTFHVALPAALDDAASSPLLKPRNQKSGALVLVIDRDADAIRRLQDVMETDHLRIYGTCGANDGLMLAHELRPDLIVLDLAFMPEGGPQTLEALRCDPNTMHIPIVAVTEHGELDPLPDNTDRVLRAGGPDALRTQIRAVLRRMETRQEVMPR